MFGVVELIRKLRVCFPIGFFLLVPTQGLTQDRTLADSLIDVYKSQTFQGDEKELLGRIVEVLTNPDTLLQYSNLLIRQAEIDSSFSDLANGYLQRGNALQLKGSNPEALQAYFKSLRYANLSANELLSASLMISIADTYSIMDDTVNARDYYRSGIKMLRKTGDSIKIGTALNNAGDDFFNAGQLDSSLILTTEAAQIFEMIEYELGQAYSLGNIGMVFAERGQDSLAEAQINEAVQLLEVLEDYYPISVYLTFMSDIYLRKNDFPKALTYALRSLELAQAYNLKEQISDANLKLTELYEVAGDSVRAYKYYKDHIAYRDSVQNIEAVQQMANERTEYEVSQMQLEVDLLNQQKRNQLIVLGFTSLLLLTLLWYYRSISREKKKSEQLLLNILPEDTARELKLNGKVKARKHEWVTVLFSDFKGFTSYSENLSPEALVQTVDYYFSGFDSIIEKHGLEKIKTIGDAYMCVSGLQASTNDHTLKMLDAAFEIADFVESAKERADMAEIFEVRIGINSGPVVAGVVGTKKFAYDIWGDTVNVAARMESLSEPGRINIGEATYERIKDYYSCEYRGEIPVKNRGNMKMYFVQNQPLLGSGPSNGAPRLNGGGASKE
jgi:class 3 adenylate cyclase